MTDGLIDEKEKATYGIVLGNKVNEDGTLSARLKARVDKAFELYEDSIIQQIIVSGGLGKEGHLEGTVMAEYLQKKGIPSKKIIIDNQGNTTYLTAFNAQTLISKTEKVIVISQHYHIRRCKIVFEKLGFTNVQGVHSDCWEFRDFYAIFREFFAIYQYKIKY